MTLIDILGLILENIASSHGYTLSVWSGGMLAIIRYGNPKVRDIILFLVGSISAYSALGGALLLRTTPERLLMQAGRPLPNFAPLTAVISSALATMMIKNRVAGYLITGFVTTFVYILSLALLLSYVMP
jgi:hypothetical protein